MIEFDCPESCENWTSCYGGDGEIFNCHIDNPHDIRPGIIFEWGNYGAMNITQDLRGSYFLNGKGIECISNGKRNI
jgi:hypothetical protein